MKKVTTGSAHYGGGHDSLAVILTEIINQLNIPNKRYESSVYYLHGKKASFSYRLIGPTSLYNKPWHKTNNLIGREILVTLLDTIVEREIKNVIKKYSPDLFLVVHPFYSHALAKLKVPYILFVTDPFSVHAIWADTEAKKIVVFTRKAKHILINFRVPKENIIVTKFPLREQFYKKYDRSKLRQELKINKNAFVLVIGGSGEGMENITKACVALHKTKLNFKAFVVCGKNLVLRTRLATRLFQDKRFVVLGYCDNMASLLTSADLFIGKTGANIMFECLATKTPMIVTAPVLAQEEGNRDFIKDNNLGWVEVKTENIINIVKSCMKDYSLVTEKKRRIVTLQKKYLADKNEFAAVISKLLN